MLTTNKPFPTLRFFLPMREVPRLHKHGLAGPSQWEQQYQGNVLYCPRDLDLLKTEEQSQQASWLAHLTKECVIHIPDGLEGQVRKPCLIGHHIQKLCILNTPVLILWCLPSLILQLLITGTWTQRKLQQPVFSDGHGVDRDRLP